MLSWTAPVDRLPGVCRWRKTNYLFKTMFACRFILINVDFMPLGPAWVTSLIWGVTSHYLRHLFFKRGNTPKAWGAAMWHLDPDISQIAGSYIHVPLNEEFNRLLLVWRYFPTKVDSLIEPKLAGKYVQSKKIEWAVIGNSDLVWRTEPLRVRHTFLSSEYKHPLPWIKGIHWFSDDVDPVLPHWMLDICMPEMIAF